MEDHLSLCLAHQRSTNRTSKERKNAKSKLFRKLKKKMNKNENKYGQPTNKSSLTPINNIISIA